MQQQIDGLWDWDDPAGSEARFRDAAESAASAHDRAILLTQLARALALQGRGPEALDILDALAEDDAELEARIALERGRVLNSSGDPNAARPQFERALAIAEAGDREHLAVDALHMLAIVAPPAEQVALNERAIAMAEAASDPRARQWLASLHNNLGWTRFEAGNHEEALRLFELALAERRARGEPRETGVAQWAVARALRALGRTDEALQAQRQLADDYAALGVDDPYVDEELGECLLGLGREAEARPHFAKAAAGLAADAWLVEHEPARIARLRDLAASQPDGQAAPGGPR
ncbi:MAG TPA: tetratricopeptide repeat protein [Candidatus Limnocylindria bacterium]|nr:tetratricopeptide repeat protein [Candidatus Limnocylindria bacterium]